MAESADSGTGTADAADAPPGNPNGDRPWWRHAATAVRAIVDAADRWWHALLDRLPAGPRFDVLVSVTVVGYVVINAARSALDDAVQAIHPAGEDGVGVNTLHDGHDAVVHALDVWARGQERIGRFIRFDAVELAFLQTVLELVLVPFSVALLFGVASRLRARSSADGRARDANVITLSMLGAIAYLVVGVYNQLAELMILAADRPVGVITPILALTGRLRLLMLVLTIVPMVVVALRPIIRDRALPSGWSGVLSTYRITIVIAALQAVIVLWAIPGAQIADAIRLWELRPSLGVVGIVTTTVLGLVLALYALRAGLCPPPVARILDRRRTIVFTVAGVALVGLGVAARWGAPALSPSLTAAGAITTLLGALSLPLVGSSPPSPHASAAVPPRSVRVVPAVVAAIPVTALTVAVVRAAIPAWIDRSSEVEDAWTFGFAVWAIVLGVIATAMYPTVTWAANRVIDHVERLDTSRFRTAGIALFLWFVLIAVLVVAEPVERAPTLGVVGILATFLSLLVITFGGLALALDQKPIPASLEFIGFRKMPVVIGVIVLGIVSNQLATDRYHDIATIDGAARPARSQLTIDEAFSDWVDAHVPADASTPSATPMFFVAAAGGGIKAAAFTAAALDCMFSPAGDRADGEGPCATDSSWESVFVASGASGGSVGIASVLAEVAQPSGQRDWVSDTLGDDLLSASAAWQFFVEVPNAVLSFNPADDRAAVLEQSWRAQFGLDADSVPFYTDRSSDSWNGPLAFFSGTNLTDGCRVNVAPVRGAATSAAFDAEQQLPTTSGTTCADRRTIDAGLLDQTDTRDLVDYLCDGANIDLATAAFLSARFPYVSPAGTARSCGDTVVDEVVAVGDGGYRDNSGASTIDQLWSVLEPTVASHNAASDACIVPILIEISSGYAGLSSPDLGTAVSQFVAPITGATAVYGDLSYGEIEQMAAEFTRPIAPDLEVHFDERPFARHLRVSLVAHPGVTAPLGWSLSRAAVDDFAEQLSVPENQAVIDDVRAIVESPDRLSCSRQPHDD